MLNFTFNISEKPGLDELVTDGYVEIQDPHYTEGELNGVKTWSSHRVIIVKAKLLQLTKILGNFIDIQCYLPGPYYKHLTLAFEMKHLILKRK